MKYQKGISTGGLTLVMTIVSLALVITANFFSCTSKWKLSGMKSSYGPMQGCLVQLPDGRWLPEERIREIDIKPKETK